MTTHTSTTQRAFLVHIGLLESLLGPQQSQHAHLHLAILNVVTTLSDADMACMEHFIAHCKAHWAIPTTDVATLAHRFQISASTIRRELQRGALRGYKSNQRWHIPEVEVERYVQSHTYHGRERVYPDDSPIGES